MTILERPGPTALHDTAFLLAVRHVFADLLGVAPFELPSLVGVRDEDVVDPTLGGAVWQTLRVWCRERGVDLAAVQVVHGRDLPARGVERAVLYGLDYRGGQTVALVDPATLLGIEGWKASNVVEPVALHIVTVPHDPAPQLAKKPAENDDTVV